MFGNGDVSVFGGSLSFFASLPDGRRFAVVILPDEQPEGPRAARDFSQHQARPITPAVVRSYLPDYAGITWRAAPPTYFGRTEERGTNGRFRVGLLAGRGAGRGHARRDAPVARRRHLRGGAVDREAAGADPGGRALGGGANVPG